MKSLLITCILLVFFSCSRDRISAFEFFEGTWKVENKDQYEVWTKDGRNELVGYSYKYTENQKTILEYIAIKMADDRIIYEATVPDQNEGKTIQFTWNPEIKSCFSFENLKHDFPKKIQYQRESENEIRIRVEGDTGEGFSYTLIRQAAE